MRFNRFDDVGRTLVVDAVVFEGITEHSKTVEMRRADDELIREASVSSDSFQGVEERHRAVDGLHADLQRLETNCDAQVSPRPRIEVKTGGTLV